MNTVARFLVARPMAKAAWRIVPDLEAGGSTVALGFSWEHMTVYPLVMTNIAMV